MRDTDIGWMTKLVAVSGGPVVALADLRNRILALGSRDPTGSLSGARGLGRGARLPHAALQQQPR